MSFEPNHKIILGLHLGDMSQKSSNEIIKQTAKVIDETTLPLFVTDGREYYKQSLIDRYSTITQPHPIIKNGRLQKPIVEPLEGLKYAQVVKTVKSGKIEKVEKRIIFGNPKEIKESDISTTLIERENLNLRQEIRRLSRKTISFSKKDEWLQSHFDLYKSYHNLVRKHHSLKKENLKQIKGKVWKKYDKITPMMSIGKTDHAWSFKELLTYPYHKNISI